MSEHSVEFPVPTKFGAPAHYHEPQHISVDLTKGGSAVQAIVHLKSWFTREARAAGAEAPLATELLPFVGSQPSAALPRFRRKE